jgi:hypothetical protein
LLALPLPAPPAHRPDSRLHPPAAPTAEVRATTELRTDDLRALRGIELRAGIELHKDELHLSNNKVTLC